MDKWILETDRLYVRKFTREDLSSLHSVMSLEKVHKFTFEEPWPFEQTTDQIEWFLQNNGGLNYAPGCFNCALILKNSDKLIGRIGINPYREGIPEIEWILHPDYWGNGYSTEVGHKMLAYALKEFSTVQGFCHPLNIGSIKVMQAIGMVYVGEIATENNKALLFEIKRSNLPKQ